MVFFARGIAKISWHFVTIKMITHATGIQAIGEYILLA
jgi:hypothetical protein